MSKKPKAENTVSTSGSVPAGTELCNPYAGIGHESVSNIVERFRWFTEETSACETREIMIRLGQAPRQ